MSTASATRIFGLRLGVDPKWLLGGLIALAAILTGHDWLTSGDSTALVAGKHNGSLFTAPPNGGTKANARAFKHRSDTNLIQVLKFELVDGSRGNIDPRLRLDLLNRLHRMPEPGKSRSLFEVAGATPSVAAPAPPIAPLIVPVVAVTPTPTKTAAPDPEFPLKYYGFAKSPGVDKTKRGFFLDGSDVLIGSQGEFLEQRYRVVALNADVAELEDVATKSRRTLAAPSQVSQ